jgi:serine/threonine-protein kinase HipA
MNPNIDKADHVLNIDDTDNRPDLQTVLATGNFYGLDPATSTAIVREVVDIVGQWRDVASNLKLARGDIVLMEGAFQACAEYMG